MQPTDGREDVTSTLNGLAIRQRLGRKDWGVPEPFGPGWRYFARATTGSGLPLGSIIVSVADHGDEKWVHASIARQTMPTYEDLCLLHAAVWPDGHAYQAFVPPKRHVNIHPNALHLWGRLDGKSIFPPLLDELVDAIGSI